MCIPGAHPVDLHVLEEKHVAWCCCEDRLVLGQAVELVMEVEPRNSWDSRRQHLRRLPTWNPCLPGGGSGNQPRQCLGSHWDSRAVLAFPGDPLLHWPLDDHLRHKGTELRRMRPVSEVDI